MKFIEVTDVDNCVLKIINVQEIKNVQEARYSGNAHIVLHDGLVITVNDNFDAVKRKLIKAGGSIY